MAIRIENTNAVNFGTFDAETTVTHARALVGSDILTTRPLATQRTIAANGQAQFDAGEIDLVFPSNQMENAGYNALLALALDGTNALTIKLLTDATTEVTTTGYDDQDVTAWTRTPEAD